MHNPKTSAGQTVGGIVGHLSRRAIHVLMIIFPVIYYLWGNDIAQVLHLLPWQFLVGLLIAIIVIEFIRVKTGFILFGQRRHEVHHISSFAWSAVAIIVVLLCLPQPIYAIPIVAGCAVGDPLLGELRVYYSAVYAAVITAVVIALIWWLCSIWMFIPWWLPILMGPLTVTVERPNLWWIDDNALMMWVPLLFVWGFIWMHIL